MTRIHVLGGGTPEPTPDRFGSAYVAAVGDEFLMIDCGPAATWKLVKAGMNPGQINNLFFTHHHYDHDVDYPCFLLNRWGHHDWGQLEELKVYGPNYTETLTDRILNPDYGAWAPDWTSRTKHPASLSFYQNRGGTLPRRGPQVMAQDIVPGAQVEGDGWRITTSHAQHFQPFLDSLAYRLDTEDGSIVFTGDTEPCDSVTELARGADVLICMCWDLQDDIESSGEHTGQSGTQDAARMAREAGVGRLVLTHVEPQIASGKGREAALEDVTGAYDGEVTMVDEFDTIELGD